MKRINLQHGQTLLILHHWPILSDSRYVLGSQSADRNAPPDFHLGVLLNVNDKSSSSFNNTKTVECLQANNVADIDVAYFTTTFYMLFCHNASALSRGKSSTRQVVEPDILIENVLG
jgi:hypothetical protein